MTESRVLNARGEVAAATATRDGSAASRAMAVAKIREARAADLSLYVVEVDDQCVD